MRRKLPTPPKFADCRSCAFWRPGRGIETATCRGCGAGENFEPVDDDDQELDPDSDYLHGRNGDDDD